MKKLSLQCAGLATGIALSLAPSAAAHVSVECASRPLAVPLIVPQYQVFVRVEGVPGSATQSKYAGWIEAAGYAFTVDQPASATTSRSSPGNAVLSPIRVVGLLDPAFPILAQMSAQGQRVRVIEVHVVDTANPSASPLLELKLTDAVVQHVGVTIDPTVGAGAPLQELSFGFQRVEWTTASPRGGRVTGTWNLASQTP